MEERFVKERGKPSFDLECGDLSSLCPVAACRRRFRLPQLNPWRLFTQQRCDRSQRTKAPTGRRTPGRKRPCPRFRL